MRTNRVVISILLLAASAAAQLVAPMEISQTNASRLQQRYWADLQRVAQAASAQSFPFPFYFSRTLDIDEPQQRRLPQSSIRFDRYNGQPVLSITGNYYASYSSELMDGQQRARQTFNDVMLPLLRAAVPPLAEHEVISGYALEVAYHVRRKVLGVDTEGPENLMLVLPRAAATKLVSATTAEGRQAAVLEGEMYLNGEPFALWLSGDVPPEQPVARKHDAVKRGRSQNADNDSDAEGQAASPASGSPVMTVSEKLLELPALPLRPISERDLAVLESVHAPVLEKLRREMQPQLHFLPYAPPSFINFHNTAYLQLSFETLLGAAANGTRYRLAALAFDDHIIYLVRPILKYFPDRPGFDGVDFSTTIHPAGSAPVSIEFVLPLNAMRCFADYGCTGQQLINAGYVLINGERAGLQLETAERER